MTAGSSAGWWSAARRPALAGGAIAVAAAVWWLAPLLLEPAGLVEFELVGRLCLIIAALSALDWVLSRFVG